LGVVVVGHRSAEHGHHGVAHELLDGAFEPFDLATDRVVVRPKRGPDVLRIGPLGPGGEPDQVAEQDRDDLSFLARIRWGLRDRRTAAPAEPEPLGIVLTAALTARHDRSLVRSSRPPGAWSRPGSGCSWRF